LTVVSVASDVDRVDWDNYVAACDDAESYHPYEWRNVLEYAFGHRCIYLMARDDSGLVCGVLPLVQLDSRLFGNFLVSIPCFNYCGTLAQDEGVRQQLVSSAWSIARDLGASHLELRHRSRVSLNLPYRDDKVSMQMNLPDTSDALWSGFSSKLRAQIRRPTKEGATCDEGGAELLDEFYSVFSRNMRDLGTPVFAKKLFTAICESFPESTKIFVVRLNGQACAAGITYGFRNRLEIPSASALREFNRVSVNMLLYWTVLKYAIREKYGVFDFGRSTKDAGTYRFKKQWGAEPEQLRWHYCLPDGADLPALNPDNAKFKFAAKIWRRLPLPVANLIGPHIVRHLP